ncbi:MAG: hypothetical protein GDA45_00725 [Chromatiales bacterium]|nr:hypothetical protein [Chromatiales bacterium]
MEQQLKQRLLGTVVLVAVAVIVLPLLLDGEGYRAMQSIEIDAPQKPPIKYQQEGFMVPLKDFNSTVLEAPQPLDIKQFDATDGESKPAQPNATATEATTENVPPIENQATTTWVMQVGSFSIAKNADEVRKQLLGLNVKNTAIEVEPKKIQGLDVYIVKVISDDYRTLSEVAGLIKEDYPDAFIKERE